MMAEFWHTMIYLWKPLVCDCNYYEKQENWPVFWVGTRRRCISQRWSWRQARRWESCTRTSSTRPLDTNPTCAWETPARSSTTRSATAIKRKQKVHVRHHPEAKCGNLTSSLTLCNDEIWNKKHISVKPEEILTLGQERAANNGATRSPEQEFPELPDVHSCTKEWSPSANLASVLNEAKQIGHLTVQQNEK